MKRFEKYFNFANLFVLIALIMGIRFIYVNPPWQSNDEDRHFYNAYAISEGILGPQYANGKAGQKLPEDLTNTVRSYQGIPFSSGTKLNKKLVEDARNKKFNRSKKSHFDNPSSGIIPFGYLPAVIGISLAKGSNKSVVDIGYWARLFSLFFYVGLVFLSLRLLPASFRPMLFIIALSPMILYQAASVSYDTLTIALLFLFMALVIRYYFTETTLEWKHVLLLIAVAFLQRFVKGGYFLLFFTALVIPMSKFKDRKIYFGMLLGMLVAAFVPGMIWKAYIGSLNIPKEAFNFFQKDFRFDSGANTKYQLQDPLGAFVVVMQNIFTQGKVWLSGAIGRFGYSYSLLPATQILLWYSVFILTAGCVREKVNWKFIGLFSMLGLASVMAIVVGFYLASPIGSKYIYGLQGRYFSPLLPFLFFGMFNLFYYKMPPKFLKIALSLVAIVLLHMSVNFLDSVFFNA
jgi:uncharacterized membrane protein